MLTIETTRNCGQTPKILFLLEELEAPYRLVLRPDQYFWRVFGRPGPRVQDGPLAFRSGLTAFRHLARTRGGGRLLAGDATRIAQIEQVIDSAWISLGLGVVALLNARKAGAGVEEAEARLAGALRELNDDVGDSELVLGDLSAADAALANLSRLGALVDLTAYPNVKRYAAALAARPAAERVERRLEELYQSEQVLEFWFGEPARDEAELRGKVRRWFMGGGALDAEISSRFKPLVEAALAGRLAGWAESPRGALALIILLDQFTRQVFRGDRRSHDGDQLAVATTLRAVARGDLAGFEDVAERSFLIMPLLHAEDAQLQAENVRLVEEIAGDAPEGRALLISAAREQARKYGAIIARFGRFPHRNALLGRVSSPEELDFLKDFAKHAPPQIAREIEAEALRR